MPDSPLFLDSNIMIYAYSVTEPKKSEIARRIIGSGKGVISAQVINEFVSVTHRKLNHPLETVETAIREFLPFVRSVPLATSTSLLALRIAREHRLAWYDSLIIAAALENGCSLLLSEDMQHGRVIEETLAIRNPFRTDP